jgi:hypothetical protein
MRYNMKKASIFLALALLASSAQAQNSGNVTANAFAVGVGPGAAGFASVLCTQAQIAIGQSAAKPICAALSGDVTMTASGVSRGVNGRGRNRSGLFCWRRTRHACKCYSDKRNGASAYDWRYRQFA